MAEQLEVVLAWPVAQDPHDRYVMHYLSNGWGIVSRFGNRFQLQSDSMLAHPYQRTLEAAVEQARHRVHQLDQLDKPTRTTWYGKTGRPAREVDVCEECGQGSRVPLDDTLGQCPACWHGRVVQTW